MRKDADGSHVYSPTDLVKFIGSPFVTWMDRVECDAPGTYPRDPREETMWQTEGFKHEAETLKLLELEIGPAVDLGHAPDRYQATLDAMAAGAPLIFQAELRLESFRGYADFLIRVPGKSRWGDFHYEVWDTKLARSAKPAYAIQLCCYSEMLAAAQGHLPEALTVFLGNGRRERFRTEDYFFYYRAVKAAFRRDQANFAGTPMPIPQPGEDTGHWSTFASDLLERLDHPSRVANLTGAQIKRLSTAGLTTMTKLAQAKPKDCPRDLDPALFAKHVRQARLQVASRGQSRPKFEVLPHAPGGVLGLAALPPADPGDVYFDLEGYPLAARGLEYLWGVVYREHDRVTFQDWWAHDEVGERRALEAFVDWVYPRWRARPDMHVYHYGNYEIAVLRDLSCRYATREDQVDEMLRGRAFVDLYSVVRHGLAIGEPGYSIKNVEKIYGQARAGAVGAAGDSIVEYHRWLNHPDGADHRASAILKSIRDYNEDDCRSTLTLTEWLRALQNEHRIGHHAEVDTEPTPTRDRDPEDILAEDLRRFLPAHGPLDDRARLIALVADVLGFYDRELKPQYWAKFDRLQNKNADDLFGDPECLAHLTRTAAAPVARGTRTVLEFGFDPAQETKFDRGADCIFHHDPELRGRIEDFDLIGGRVSIGFSDKVSEKLNALPSSVSILPDVARLTEHLKPSIIATAERLAQSLPHAFDLPKCLLDFLSRRGPDTTARPPGAPLIQREADRVDEAVEIVLGLNQSALCLQGPPGTGKTYTAAHLVLALLRAGHRVGVTANSHKAVDNLLREVTRRARASGFEFTGCTIGGDQEDVAAELGFHWSKSASDYYPSRKKRSQLVGGTVWAFAAKGAVDQYDYLFVEEAGQFAMAHLFAAARATRNLVLLGDQMQLEQPTQGKHPGDSGQSCLQYFMNGRATMPPELGIFLPETRRLHPAICDFISGAIYEGRLRPHPGTRDRVIIWDAAAPDLICTAPAGVFFHGVTHEGNSNASSEEVAAIVTLVNQLVNHARVTDGGGGTRPVTLDDILFIAPYNMQRARLQAAFPTARVGTVDLFQGQEAPIVILSMCSSSTDLSSRGMEFLFSRHRINVAVSRAQSLAIVVGHPGLRLSRAPTMLKAALVNLYCRLSGGEDLR